MVHCETSDLTDAVSELERLFAVPVAGRNGKKFLTWDYQNYISFKEIDGTIFKT